MAVLDTLNEIRKRHGAVPLQEGGAPAYTHENNLTTLAGATGIGAGKTLSHMFLSALGGAMNYVGSWLPQNESLTENDRNILYSLGMTDEEIDLQYPKRDNLLKQMGKGYLGMGAAAGNKLDEWKQDLLGEYPTDWARIAEGTGTSLGHAAGSYLLGGLAALLPFNPIGSMTEAWTEYGGFNDEAYRKGLIDKPGVGDTGLTLLATNAAYNWVQDKLGGAISGAIGKSSREHRIVRGLWQLYTHGRKYRKRLHRNHRRILLTRQHGDRSRMIQASSQN